MNIKIRLDEYLVQCKEIENINIARSLIVQGKVFVNKKICTKSGTLINFNSQKISINLPLHQYVSRGALKLIKAIDYFNIKVENLICLDIGCSTGGFTQVLLENKARKIYAVDVGYGELHYKLRDNEKVCLLERTNARYLTNKEIPEPPDLIVSDVSFISLTKVLPPAIKLAQKKCQLVCLIKPQFEAPKNTPTIKGIIKDPKIHELACDKIRRHLLSYNFNISDITTSPIFGAKGNKEFLIYADRNL